jgi:hypothetical protein
VRKDREGREVLEESEWMIVYKLADGQSLHESKFLVKGATITAESLRGRWDSFSQKERYDFVRAYQAKPEVTSEDEKILDFLMDTEDYAVWITIAPLLARHKDRARVLGFLLSKIQQPIGPKANFYQVLGVLSDLESVPVLKQALSKHREEVDRRPSLQSWDDRLIYLDYLSCSATLFEITHDEEFKQNLRRVLRHPQDPIQEMVRAVANSYRIRLD